MYLMVSTYVVKDAEAGCRSTPLAGGRARAGARGGYRLHCVLDPGLCLCMIQLYTGTMRLQVAQLTPHEVEHPASNRITLKSRNYPVYFLGVPFASVSKRLLMKSRCVGRPQLAAAADRPLLSSWVCWSLAASHRLAHRAWRRQMAGGAARPVAGSCGRRAPEGLMDSKDLLVLAALVMRSIR